MGSCECSINFCASWGLERAGEEWQSKTTGYMFRMNKMKEIVLPG